MLRKLGVFERALFISDQHAPFNVVSVLRLEDTPETDVLLAALKILQKRHPLLKGRIQIRDKGLWFEMLPDPTFPFRTLERGGDAMWMSIVEQEMNMRLDPSLGPLFRCTYLLDGVKGEIILTFHHSILDAASGMNLLDELLETCAALQRGQPANLPVLTVVPPVEKRFPPAFMGLKRVLPTLIYALSQMGDETGYQWHVRGRRNPPMRNGGRGHILTLFLSESLVDELARRGRQQKVTLNSLLNAALMLAVNRHLYGGQATPMRTFTFADLRPYTVPPTPAENLANYISMLRLTLNVSGGRDIWNLAKELHAKIYRSLKRGDKFIASLMSESLMKMFTTLKSMRMGSTALNYSGVVPVKPRYGDIRVTGLHGFLSSYDLGPELSSQARLFNDQIWWDFMYLDTDMDRALAGKIVEEIRLILENAAGRAV